MNPWQPPHESMINPTKSWVHPHKSHGKSSSFTVNHHFSWSIHHFSWQIPINPMANHQKPLVSSCWKVLISEVIPWIHRFIPSTTKLISDSYLQLGAARSFQGHVSIIPLLESVGSGGLQESDFIRFHWWIPSARGTGTQPFAPACPCYDCTWVWRVGLIESPPKKQTGLLNEHVPKKSKHVDQTRL